MAIYGSPTVGRLGIVTRPSSCNQAALGLVADTKQISQTFLYFVLLALRDHFNGMAQGAAQQNISKEKVAGTSALVPPRALVTAFDRVAEPIFSQLQTLQRQIENLCRTRDLLLPRLLSGQVNLEEN
jgi:type I restriction enzyme S subunit